jgi:hypothetical protein
MSLLCGKSKKYWVLGLSAGTCLVLLLRALMPQPCLVREGYRRNLLSDRAAPGNFGSVSPTEGGEAIHHASSH